MTPNAQITSAAVAILALCLLALVSGCGTTGHVAVMHDMAGDVDTKGQNPVCTAEIRKALSDRLSAKYLHQSWCSSGWPVNDNSESTIDAVGVELRVW